MSTPRPAPYPADTRAKGWRFELDYEVIDQSDTWGLAAAMAMDGLPLARPLLLAAWYAAWKQTPCGSLPSDDRLIAAAIGIPMSVLVEYREVLLRGWWLADDDRLYHDTLTKRVEEMIEYRRKNAKRVADFKALKREQQRGNALPECEQQGKNDTGTGTGTLEKTSHLPVAPARPSAEPPPSLALVEAPSPKGKTVPDCPHVEILALWAEVLPAMPQHLPDLWKGARADHLRVRWRETAEAKGWTEKAQGIEFFRRLFAYIGKSPFLTGRAKPSGADKRPFVIELEWLVLPSNWAKTIEGKYHAEAA